MFISYFYTAVSCNARREAKFVVWNLNTFECSAPEEEVTWRIWCWSKYDIYIIIGDIVLLCIYQSNVCFSYCHKQ